MPRKERPCRECPSKRYGNVSWCYKHWLERKRRRMEETKAKRLARKLASKKYQQSELKTWRRKTWEAMSEWIRRSSADWRGYATCYTCSSSLPWKEMHCGHFKHGKLDYDERNLKVQCPACNTYLDGELDVYAHKLVNEYGLEWFNKLVSDAAQHPGYTLDEVKKIHAELKEKLATLN